MTAANLSSVADIFAGASVTSGILSIPSGTMISYNPSTITSPAGYEAAFGLVETIHRALVNFTGTQIESTSTQSISGSTLKKTYTIVCNLNAPSGIVDALDVKGL